MKAAAVLAVVGRRSRSQCAHVRRATVARPLTSSALTQSRHAEARASRRRVQTRVLQLLLRSELRSAGKYDIESSS